MVLSSNDEDWNRIYALFPKRINGTWVWCDYYYWRLVWVDYFNGLYRVHGWRKEYATLFEVIASDS